jgi:hypothetical protein
MTKERKRELVAMFHQKEGYSVKSLCSLLQPPRSSYYCQPIEPGGRRCCRKWWKRLRHDFPRMDAGVSPKSCSEVIHGQCLQRLRLLPPAIDLLLQRLYRHPIHPFRYTCVISRDTTTI